MKTTSDDINTTKDFLSRVYPALVKRAHDEYKTGEISLSELIKLLTEYEARHNKALSLYWESTDAANQNAGALDK